MKNGNLQIDGQIDGDVTLINGKLIMDLDDVEDGNEFLVAHVGVSGEFNQIDEWVEWIWYKAKTLFENIFSLTINNVGLF